MPKKQHQSTESESDLETSDGYRDQKLNQIAVVCIPAAVFAIVAVVSLPSVVLPSLQPMFAHSRGITAFMAGVFGTAALAFTMLIVTHIIDYAQAPERIISINAERAEAKAELKAEEDKEAKRYEQQLASSTPMDPTRHDPNR